MDFYFRAKEKQPEAEKKEEVVLVKNKGRLVVDTPENPEIQKAMLEVQKYLTAIEVVVREHSKYRCQESYQHLQSMLDMLWLSLGDKVLDLRGISPKIIEKQY